MIRVYLPVTKGEVTFTVALLWCIYILHTIKSCSSSINCDQREKKTFTKKCKVAVITWG